MVDFQWETYTPYSIGFNETFSRLESLAGGGKNYPPYNIVTGPNGTTTLEIALAGFSEGDIKVETERNVLTVSAQKSPEEKEREYTHRGISYKTFARNWQMADDVEIEEVQYENGLLTIILKKELPEHQKRKTWF
tara:strand:+ start:439 stop:843 length:405 start_codon:yes stop_codon:yes gene_type:complete